MRYKGAKGRAWQAMAAYIKARDGWVCITCGKEEHGRGMHAGHFIPVGMQGSNSALAWNERNVYAQCLNCNVNLGGWGERFAEALEARHGADEVAALRAMRHKTERHPLTWEETIEHYKARLKDLE